MKNQVPHGEQSRLRVAAISTDREFLRELEASLEAQQPPVTMAAVINTSFTDVDDSHLETLRRVRPDVVFLDLDSDPQIGLRFAEFLVDSSMAGALVGVGSADSSDLLLRAMQAGISEFLPKPVDAENVHAALERVARKTGTQIDRRPQEPGSVLAVFSPKGGSGCTTVAVNVATEIQRLTRERTLLLDLDLELGETALLLGTEPKFSVVDLMRNFHRVDTGLLASYIERHASGLELLSAPHEPVDFEAVSGSRVRQVLDFLRQQYSYIVVDCPKTFNPATRTIFESLETLLLVVTADLPSLRNVTRCLPLLRSARRDPAESWLRLVINRYDPNDVITLAEIKKTVRLEPSYTVRNDYAAVTSSINAGKPAVLEGKSNFAADVRALAADLTGVEAGSDSAGLLDRLKRTFFHGSNGRAASRSRRRMTVND